MDNLKQLIATLGIKVGIVSAPFNPNMENSEEMFHWACTLSSDANPSAVLNLIYSTGGGHLRARTKPLNYRFDGASFKEFSEIKNNPRNYYYDFKVKAYRPFYGRSTVWMSNLIDSILEPAPPTVEQILDTLLMEAEALNYDSFEDWANDMGYDTDSRKALAIFEVCRKQGRQLQVLLGEHFRTAMEMERL